MAEFQPPAERAHGMSIEENAGMGAQERVGSALADADIEKGQLFCSPVDASMASDPYNQPSLAQMGKSDGNPEEQRAHRPHSVSRKHLNAKSSQSPWTVPTRKPKYDADGFEDPVCDEFWKGIWVACAAHNVGVYGFSQVKFTTNCQIPHQTEIFRRVFRVVPDDLVTTWKHYKDFVAYQERLVKPVRESFLLGSLSF